MLGCWGYVVKTRLAKPKACARSAGEQTKVAKSRFDDGTLVSLLRLSFMSEQPRHVRINDLAKELGVKSKAVMSCLTRVSISEPKTHSSSLTSEEADRVRRFFADVEGSKSQAASTRLAKPRRLSLSPFLKYRLICIGAFS